MRPCIVCGRASNSGRCAQHPLTLARRAYDRARGTSTQRGYGSDWRKARREYLAEHRLCVECLREGVYTTATDVDHIVDHHGDPVKFWDSENNWQALCHRHHSAKTSATRYVH